MKSKQSLLNEDSDILNQEMINKNPMSSFRNLFPTKLSFVVFIAYMALFINQGNVKNINFNQFKLNCFRSFGHC